MAASVVLCSLKVAPVFQWLYLLKVFEEPAMYTRLPDQSRQFIELHAKFTVSQNVFNHYWAWFFFKSPTIWWKKKLNSGSSVQIPWLQFSKLSTRDILLQGQQKSLLPEIQFYLVSNAWQTPSSGQQNGFLNTYFLTYSLLKFWFRYDKNLGKVVKMSNACSNCRGRLQ